MRDRVGSFYAVLDSVASKESTDLVLTGQQRDELLAQRQACEELLKELDEYLKAYSNLGKQSSGLRSTLRKTKSRLTWTHEDVDQYRQRLISHAGMLNSVNMTLTKSVESRSYILDRCSHR